MEINNSFGPIDIAISGLRAHGKSIELISSNIANARTTNAGKGEPYRRLEAMLKKDGDDDISRADILNALDGVTNNMKKGGLAKKMAAGGSVSASRRGDGIARKGKTKGRFI